MMKPIYTEVDISEAIASMGYCELKEIFDIILGECENLSEYELSDLLITTMEKHSDSIFGFTKQQAKKLKKLSKFKEE